MSIYEKMLERYTSGALPWDSPLPPPEVIDLAEKLEPGRALDLGCGFGRAAIFLAEKGWRVDGVDFVPQAILEAVDRANAAGVSSQVNFHVASVADLGFLKGQYDIALDVGCLHALSAEELRRYAAGLRRLLKPGAIFLLFVRLGLLEEVGEEGPPALPEKTIREVFGRGFELEKVEYGETQVEDHPAWRSGWFWFRRL